MIGMFPEVNSPRTFTFRENFTKYGTQKSGPEALFTPWTPSLQCSPRTLSQFKGPTSNGREKKEREEGEGEER